MKGRPGLILLIAIGIAVAWALYEILGGGMPSQAVQILAQAIARAEGFGVAGAIPTQANNPGDITQAGQGYAGDTGNVLGSANVIVFDTVTDGWNALYAQVENMLSGNDTLWPASLTLQQAGLQYSGGSQAWVNNVAEALGVDPSVTLGELAGVQS